MTEHVNKPSSTTSSTTDRLKEAAVAAKDKAVAVGSEQARQAANKVGDHVVNRVVDHVDEAEATMSSIADGLRENDQVTIAGYADDLAARVSGVSTMLRERSAEQLMADVSRAAKSNPSLFIAGSLAAGFMLSRFFLASSDSRNEVRSKAMADSSQASSGTPDVRSPAQSTAGTSTSANAMPGRTSPQGAASGLAGSGTFQGASR